VVFSISFGRGEASFYVLEEAFRVASHCSSFDPITVARWRSSGPGTGTTPGKPAAEVNGQPIYHDVLFDTAPRTGGDELEADAYEVGPNFAKFDQGGPSAKTKEVGSKDIDEGARLSPASADSPSGGGGRRQSLVEVPGLPRTM